MNTPHEDSVELSLKAQTHTAANSGNTVYPTSFNGAYRQPPARDDRYVVEWQMDPCDCISDTASIPPLEAAKFASAMSVASRRHGSHRLEELCRLDVRLSAVLIGLIVGVVLSTLAALARIAVP